MNAAIEDPVSDREFDRYLIRGELRQRPKQFRGRDEAVALAHAVGLLANWNDGRPEPRREVLIDLGYRLRDTPRTAVDIALSVLSAEASAANPGDVSWMDARPELAIEIVNHREPRSAIRERVAEYCACGVPLVWVFDPPARAAEVFTSADENATLTVLLGPDDVLTGGSILPGFSARVADFFR